MKSAVGRCSLVVGRWLIGAICFFAGILVGTAIAEVLR